MRILLFGANGQVGTELRRSLAPLGEIVAATRSGALPDGTPCEAADFDAPGDLPALVERIAPDLVVNAAAYTAVDRAEDDAAAAFRANAQAPGTIAEACARRGIAMVHYSTDYVFDGTAARPYREDDPTHPLGVYGTSKLAGEDAVRASGARHVVFRTAWVYAAGHGHNFLRTMLRLARERDELRIVDDQVGSPTSAAWIADATRTAIARGLPASGVRHMTCTGQTSWHGFAEAIFASACGSGVLERSPRLVAIPTADYPTRARRPAYSVLDTGLLARESGLSPPHWRVAMDAGFRSLAS